MTLTTLIKNAGARKLASLLVISAVFVSSCQKDEQVSPTASDTTPSIKIKTAASGPQALSTFLGVTTKSSAPVSLYKKSNVTISGLTISGGSSPCIQLTDCTNIHITKCKISNTSNYGILIGSGCSNILIDSCLISNVATGVFAVSCPNGMIRVMSNQFQNMKGPFPKGDFVQFSNVGGKYNRVEYNICENIQGQSNPEDGISMYKSSGISGDPICIIGNQIRGGGPSTTGSGITVGDQGGAYILAMYNTIVNAGYVGMHVAGGHDIQLYNNTITSTAFPWSHLGLGSGNYSGQPSYNITINGNKVKWISGWAPDQVRGSTSIEKDLFYQVGTSMPAGWSSNVAGASISTSVLPSTMITWY